MRRRPALAVRLAPAARLVLPQAARILGQVGDERRVVVRVVPARHSTVTCWRAHWKGAPPWLRRACLAANKKQCGQCARAASSARSRYGGCICGPALSGAQRRNSDRSRAAAARAPLPGRAVGRAPGRGCGRLRRAARVVRERPGQALDEGLADAPGRLLHALACNLQRVSTLVWMLGCARRGGKSATHKGMRDGRHGGYGAQACPASTQPAPLIACAQTACLDSAWPTTLACGYTAPDSVQPGAAGCTALRRADAAELAGDRADHAGITRRQHGRGQALWRRRGPERAATWRRAKALLVQARAVAGHGEADGVRVGAAQQLRFQAQLHPPRHLRVGAACVRALHAFFLCFPSEPPSSFSSMRCAVRSVSYVFISASFQVSGG